ncbi:MAG TPA: alpha-amylase family glycosyl hydrolase, partial [Ignavibacteriaceae bacterium]|nr:alpha-amylase family glycosyl hydrolase [Ignavibacteriaceae bacterium]
MIKIFRYFIIFLVFQVLLYAQSDSSLIPVEFDFYKVLQLPDVGVGINGTFNNWGNNPDGSGNNKHIHVLVSTGDNNWKTIIQIPKEVVEYKFVTYQIGTNGDTIISSWITDPTNSNFGGPYNNSRMNVADPMIYYLQPMNGTSINIKRPAIYAKISWANSSSLDLSSLKLFVDNVEILNASQYFDTTTRTFSYTPTADLIPGKHSAELSVANNSGTSDDETTNFTVVNAILKAPYTFVFDPYSPNFKLVGKINQVGIKATFNNLGSDPMAGPDSEGLYKITVPLQIGVPDNYQYIINGGQYIDDPDNPLMAKDFGTIVVKHVDPNPHFDVLSPGQGQLFSQGENLVINANLIESDSGYAINKDSIKILLDGSPLSIASIDSIGNGVNFKSAPFMIQPGRHQIIFTGQDTTGIKTKYYLTFGSFNQNTGFHFIDEDFDDYGPGNYTYPNFSAKGSADFKEIDINSNTTNDSLLFTVSLASITDYTRVGFEIINSLNDSLSLAPDKAGIQIPDVSSKGIFLILSDPNSSQKTNYDNLVFDNFGLNGAIDTLVVNADAKTSSKFTFSIPINKIENIAGSFSKGWYFIAYSYLGNSSGGWKIASGNGGSLFPEQPNIYDAAFFYNNFLENRNNADYNFSFNYGGSRYSKLSSNKRGALFITPGDISSSLASKPYVNILANGGNIRWSDTVRVYVACSSMSISTGILNDNLKNYNLNFVNDTAFADVVLSEGLNELTADVTYNSSLKSYSAKVFFNRIVDHKPKIELTKNISGKTVSLDASATTNIDKLFQNFNWKQDSTNPQQVSLGGSSSPNLSFSVPQKTGQYFYTLTCSTSIDTSFQRVALIVDSSSASFPDLSKWHAGWIDSAVIYEVYIKSYSLDGNLTALTKKIPYIKSLGFNTIWLMPIYPGPQLSPSQPGYAITNYFNINPSYGTLNDFRKFVNTAHAYGLKVVLDYVVDHTHNTHPFALDAVKYGPKSPYYNFYGWNPDGTYKYLYTWTDFPFINFNSQRNRDYLLDVAKFWIENFNIDGYRCDAAAEVNDHHPGGSLFWQQFRSTLKNIKPDIFLLGELSSDNFNYFDKKFDSGYDYDFFNDIRNSISNYNLLKNLDTTIAYYSSAKFPSSIVPFRYIENHDQSRFISQYNVAETKLAATVLLTLPGIPMVYAGQEVGEQSYRGLIDWSDPYSLTDFYKKLVTIRDNYKSLSIGKYKEIISSSPDSIFAFARITDSLPSVILSNFTNAKVNFYINIDSLHFNMQQNKPYYFNDILNDSVYSVNSTSHFEQTLLPYDSKVLIFSDKAFITSVKNYSSSQLTYSLEQNYPNPFNPTTT